MTTVEFASAKKSGSALIDEGSLPVAYELELHRMIALAAYYRAEKDGFKCSPQEYWLAAENEVQKFP